MRRLISPVLVTVLAAGCGDADHASGAESVTPSGQGASAQSFDPARIRRVRADLPAGYEVIEATGPASPVRYWGMRSGWTADPPQCGALVDPVAGEAGQGLSGSGDGGLLHVMAAATPPSRPVPDAALLTECAQWSVISGGSTAAASLIPAPAIEDAVTTGVAASVRTVVESGTETDSQVYTFTARVDDGFVFVTLMVDPGSPHQALTSQDAADLLVKSVSAVRGVR